MNVQILINANARAIRYGRIPEKFFNRFISERVTLRVTNSVEEIDDAVNDCWSADRELVLLATGDGGLHRFLSSFIKIYNSRPADDGSFKPLPVFATFRSGTANLITGILGCHGEPLEAVRRLFARIKETPSIRELPRVRQKLLEVSDGIQKRFGFMAGSGVVYNFFLEYYKGSRYNVLKFLKIFLRAALSLFIGTGYINRLFTSMEARLRLDEKAQTLSRWKMLVVSAVDTRIVFFRAFKVGQLIDRIQIKAGNPSRLAIIRNIPNLLLNRPLKGRELLDRLVQRIHLERDAEFGYTIDGELYNATRLFFAPGPVVEFVRL